MTEFKALCSVDRLQVAGCIRFVETFATLKAREPNGRNDGEGRDRPADLSSRPQEEAGGDRSASGPPPQRFARLEAGAPLACRRLRRVSPTCVCEPPRTPVRRGAPVA